MDYKNLSGWNLRFPDHREKAESYYSDDASITERSDHQILNVPSGLHCGPAGRRTLIKWLEDNYKLSRGINNANPGVNACRLWQESQGLPDEVSKAIVGLLKLQGIPTNVTYKTLFENYLAKHLSTLMKRHTHSQKKLSFLAEKMISMFQVTQIQPLIVDLLDLLIEIPQSAMAKILEDTTSSHHFYKIATLNIKRKIWVASPERLCEAVLPLIYRSLFLLKLGVSSDCDRKFQIFEKETETGPIAENINEYNMLITQIVQLIGDPQVECSRIIYFQIVTILKILFIRSVVQYKTNITKNNKNSESGKVKENKDLNSHVKISKNIESSICFKNEVFSKMKNEDIDFQYNKVSCEDLCNLYSTYTSKIIGLNCTFMSVVGDEEKKRQSNEVKQKESKLKEDNQILKVNIDEDLVYLDRGEPFYSTIRYSIAMKCQEMYKITNSDMKIIEPNINLLQLINKVQSSPENNLPTKELMNMINKKNITNNVNIKDDLELLNISFILCNPILYNKVISYYVYYLFNMDIILLTSKVDVIYWLSLIALGLSCSYIAVVKFILEAKFEDSEGGEETDEIRRCVTYLRPYVSAGKPVSLKKVLSYINPTDKEHKGGSSELPPFFANFISPNVSSNSDGEDKNAFKRLKEFEFGDTELNSLPEDDTDTIFHSLLIVYLPKLDTNRLREFRGVSTNFLNLFIKEQTEEQEGRDLLQGEDNNDNDKIKENKIRLYKEVDFTKEEEKKLGIKILEPFNLSKFRSRNHIEQLLSILERHQSNAKKSKTSIMGQLNFTMLYIVMKKMAKLSHTVMNMLSATSNITNLMFKLITLELVRIGMKVKGSEEGEERERERENPGSLKELITLERFKKEAVVNFKTPTDYWYLKLLRIVMFSDQVKSNRDPVFKFVENVSNYSVSTSFILLYYYKKYGKDKNANQTLERLSRNCHRILYDKQNLNNPSYSYRKWKALLEEMKDD